MYLSVFGFLVLPDCALKLLFRTRQVHRKLAGKEVRAQPFAEAWCSYAQLLGDLSRLYHSRRNGFAVGHGIGARVHVLVPLYRVGVGVAQVEKAALPVLVRVLLHDSALYVSRGFDQWASESGFSQESSSTALP